MKQEKGGGEEGRGWSCNNQEADEQLENAKLAMRRRTRRGKARRGETCPAALKPRVLLDEGERTRRGGLQTCRQTCQLINI